jgi:uncharacterized protein with von Willebrand factor type A (vWA) domain
VLLLWCYRYIPNITKSLITVVEKMQRKQSAASASSANNSSSGSGAQAAQGSAALRILAQLSKHTVSETALAECLQRAVDKFESESLLQSSLDRALGDAAGKRRRLFIAADAMLAAHPLPAELAGEGALVSQASQQSAKSQYVDLTGGKEAAASPVRSAMKRSYLGAFANTTVVSAVKDSRWVRLVLPASAPTSSTAAAATSSAVIDVTGDEEVEAAAVLPGNLLPASTTCFMLVQV